MKKRQMSKEKIPPLAGLIKQVMDQACQHPSIQQQLDVIIQDINQMSANNFKSHQFPQARLRNMIKQQNDYGLLSKEVPPVVSKAVEILVTEITAKAFRITSLEGRTKIKKKDIMYAVQLQENLDFFIEALKQDEIEAEEQKKKQD